MGCMKMGSSSAVGRAVIRTRKMRQEDTEPEAMLYLEYDYQSRPGLGEQLSRNLAGLWDCTLLYPWGGPDLTGGPAEKCGLDCTGAWGVNPSCRGLAAGCVPRSRSQQAW